MMQEMDLRMGTKVILWKWIWRTMKIRTKTWVLRMKVKIVRQTWRVRFLIPPFFKLSQTGTRLIDVKRFHTDCLSVCLSVSAKPLIQEDKISRTPHVGNLKTEKKTFPRQEINAQQRSPVSELSKLNKCEVTKCDSQISSKGLSKLVF